MFNLFSKYETNKQLHKRLLKLCQEGNYGICQPPMVADVAINELRDFFLPWKRLVYKSPYFQDVFLRNKNHEECKTRATIQETWISFLAYI